MSKFLKWIDKKSDKYIWIHYDKKSRAKFRNACWLIYLCIFLIVLIASVLLGLSGLSFNSESAEYYPYWSLTTASQITEFVFGIIFLLVAFGFGTFMAIYLPGVYKESQDKYFKTNKFKETRIKYMTEDLSDYSLNELKWLKKLNYIDKVKYEQAKIAYLKTVKGIKKK